MWNRLFRYIYDSYFLDNYKFCITASLYWNYPKRPVIARVIDAVTYPYRHISKPSLVRQAIPGSMGLHKTEMLVIKYWERVKVQSLRADTVGFFVRRGHRCSLNIGRQQKWPRWNKALFILNERLCVKGSTTILFSIHFCWGRVGWDTRAEIPLTPARYWYAALKMTFWWKLHDLMICVIHMVRLYCFIWRVLYRRKGPLTNRIFPTLQR